MELAVYAVEAAVEETHWWFAGRRRLFAAELARAEIPKDARILDVGTGTGSTLRMLRDNGYTQVTGVDASDEALRFCADKGLGRVRKGDICALPFPEAALTSSSPPMSLNMSKTTALRFRKSLECWCPTARL